jgi:integrase
MSKLKDRQIHSLIIPRGLKEKAYPDGNNLYIRCYLSGTKTFFYRYKLNNKAMPRIIIGDYPHKTLAEARQVAATYNAIRKEGRDPHTEQKLKRIKEKQTKQNIISEEEQKLTVNELFQLWKTKELRYRKDAGAEVARIFNKDVLPSLGGYAARDITKQQIRSILDTILDRNINRMPKVVLSLIRQMFRFGIDRDIVLSDPTTTVRKNKVGKPDQPRSRVLSENEIRMLGKKIKGARLIPTTEYAIWIILGTGCRVGELLKARWEDIDLKLHTWQIKENKTNTPITIHLSRFTNNYFIKLKAITGHTEWCFPNTSSTNHVSDKTVTKQISDRQRLIETPMKNRTQYTKSLILSKEKWLPHDLRRTAATQMQMLGVSPDIANRCLNHKEQDQMKKTYLVYPYEKEMKKSWDMLGQNLTRLIGGL